MMHAACYGRLGQDPRSIDTKSGKAMCVTSMAVDLQDKDGESHTQWLNVVSFGRVADTLAKHSKGDLVSVSGRCQINRWTNSSGEAQVQLSIVIDSVVSARSVRPGGRKKASASSDAEGSSSAPTTDEFNDSIPF